jgi:hypothetical protein
MDDLLLSVSSPPEIDPEIYLRWLKDPMDTMDSVVNNYKELSSFKFLYRGEDYQKKMDSVIKSYVKDQCRCFDILEHYLIQPKLMQTQILYPMSIYQQSFFIEHYWALDDNFLREMIFKKSMKSRKDLQDAADITKLTHKTIMRQFENIKRVQNAFQTIIEDNNNISTTNQSFRPIIAYQFIGRHFLLSNLLAKKYCCLIYLLDAKFNWTTKKRLLTLNYANLENIAAYCLVYLNYDHNEFYNLFHADPNAGKYNNNLLLLLLIYRPTHSIYNILLFF